MNLAPLAVQQFFGNNGRPLVGGLLYTYISGTSTKQATYSDESGTLNTNPIQLDFRGECRIWLPIDKTYTFVLSPRGDTDPPTKPIWSADDISASLTLAELTRAFIGRILWPRSAKEIAASVDPVDYGCPWGAFERYGMDPEGVDDCSVQFETACSCNDKVFDYFPGGGTYKFDAEASIPNYPLCIEGAAKSEIGSISNGGTTFALTSAAGSGAACIRFTSFSDVEVCRIKFLLQNLGSAQIGMRFAELRASNIHDCSFIGTGDVTDDSTGMQFDAAGTFTGGVFVQNNYFSNHQFCVNVQAVVTDIHFIANTLYGTIAHPSSVGILFANIAANGPIVIGNSFDQLFRGVKALCPAVKQIGNRFEGPGTPWEWVAPDSLRNQSFGDTVLGGVPIFSTTDGDANQVFGGAAAFAGGQNIVTTRAYREASRAYDMGYPQAVPFNAGDFTASGAMTWTVISGNVSTFVFSVVGKTLFVFIDIAGSTLGGVASTAIRIKIPGGFVAAASIQQPITIENNGVFTSIGSYTVASSGTVINVFIDAPGATNWTLSANTGVSGVITIPVA